MRSIFAPVLLASLLFATCAAAQPLSVGLLLPQGWDTAAFEQAWRTQTETLQDVAADVVTRPAEDTGGWMQLIHDLDQDQLYQVLVTMGNADAVGQAVIDGVTLKIVMADQGLEVPGAATVGVDLKEAGRMIGAFACSIYEDGRLLAIGSSDTPASRLKLAGLAAALVDDGCEIEAGNLDPSDNDEDDFVWLATAPQVIVDAETRVIVALDSQALERAKEEARNVGMDGADVMCVLCPPEAAVDDPNDDQRPVRAITTYDMAAIGTAAADLAHLYGSGASDGLNVRLEPLFIENPPAN